LIPNILVLKLGLLT